MAKKKELSLEELRDHLANAESQLASDRGAYDLAGKKTSESYAICNKIKAMIDELIVVDKKNDWAWLLSDPNNSTKPKMDAMIDKFQGLHSSVAYSGSYNPTTDQWLVHLKLTKNRENEIEDCYAAFSQIFPFVLPDEKGTKRFPIFGYGNDPDSMATYSLITGLTLDDPASIVYDGRIGDYTEYNGTIKEMIKRIHNKYYYEDIDD